MEYLVPIFMLYSLSIGKRVFDGLSTPDRRYGTSDYLSFVFFGLFEGAMVGTKAVFFALSTLGKSWQLEIENEQRKQKQVTN